MNSFELYPLYLSKVTFSHAKHPYPIGPTYYLFLLYTTIWTYIIITYPYNTISILDYLDRIFFAEISLVEDHHLHR